MNVLIIDDDKLTINAVQHTVESLGHKATVATSGEAAIEQIGVQKFDVIISDIMMPGISGLSLVNVLRSVHLVYTPIIIMSTLSHRPLLDAAFKAGANDFLNKPFTTQELDEKLRKYDNSGQSAGQAEGAQA